MTPISAVIITFNEERNILRCLNSIREVADEIVVLDSGSNDKTKEICLQAGVKFFVHPFDGHIEQKNRAIRFAAFPHILSLDADEALSPELSLAILETKKSFTRQGYFMNRLTNYCGQWIRHSGWYPDRKLRLWDSRKGQWGGMNPHDKFELFEGDRDCGFLKGDILHYSYYSKEEHIKQVRYFGEVGAKAYFHSGKKSDFFKLWFNPAFKFFRNYFLKAGFLDGRNGFRICRFAALETYLKYLHLKNLQNAAAR